MKFEKSILEKIEKNNLSVIYELIKDVDYFVRDILEKLKESSNTPSIRNAFNLIIHKADTNLIKYMFDTESLGLLIEHPKINLIEIFNGETNNSLFYWFFDMMDWFYEREPVIVQNKLKQLIFEKKQESHITYVCYLIRISSNEEFKSLIKFLGASVIRSFIKEFILIENDIYYILYSKALKEMVENPRIDIISIIKNTLSETYVDDTIIEEYIDWIKEKAPLSQKEDS